jgi:hypothetical protein
MAGTPKFGAASGSDTHTTKVEIDKKIELATWRDKTGTTIKVKDFDPTTDFNVEIEADAVADFAPGVGGSLPMTGVTGGVSVITSTKYSESNDGKATTTVSGTNYPSGSELS